MSKQSSPVSLERSAFTVPQFRAAKGNSKLAVVTCYDYTSARLVDAAGIDAILVGDSLGMVVQGHSTSLPVTLRDVIYHTQCVVRGTRRALIVADLPFLSYQVSPRQAVRSAGKMLKVGAAAVKLEGGERMASHIEACVKAEIPIMGHIGLTPQSYHRLGGFKVQRDAAQILADAKAVADAGAFAIVVEAVPIDIAEAVTAAVKVPTIGIGAGPACDGQVLVLQDMLGFFTDFRPKFVKQYADLGGAMIEALTRYCEEVRSGAFPGPEHGFR